MKKIFITLAFILTTIHLCFAQGVVDKNTADFLRNFNDEKIKPAHIDTSYWSSSREIRFAMTIHTVSNNWYQSDNRSSFTAKSFVKLVEIYKREYTNWVNTFQLDLGFRWEDAGKLAEGARNLSVAENAFRIESEYGVKIARRFDFSTNVKLVSQIMPSYANNTAKDPNKTFMAPGYLDIGVGATYNYNNPVVRELKVSLFPINNNTTMVLNQRLADMGVAGVRPAEKDSEGNITRHGQAVKIVWGFRAQMDLKVFIDKKKNFRVENYLVLFMDYITKPGTGYFTNSTNLILPIVKDKVDFRFVCNLRYYDNEKTTRYKWITNDKNQEVRVAEIHGPTLQMVNDLNLGLTFKF